MNLLAGIERAIEEAVEGLFRGGREATHPVEIGRFLVRRMEDDKRISVSRTYVPNHYNVRLCGRDIERIGPLARTLSRELADHVISRARRQGYSFVGRVEVEFAPDEGAKPGAIRVDASFVEEEEPPSDTVWYSGGTWRARAEETPANAAGEADTLKGARTPDEEGARPHSPAGARLVMADEDGAERVCAIDGAGVVIGRAASCDIVISDPGTSRRHAEITRDGGRFYVTDLQSTNGTYVNGRRVARQLLADGDLVGFGKIAARFKEV